MATKENTPPPRAPPQLADYDEPPSRGAEEARPQRNRASVLEQVRRRKMERERARKEQQEGSDVINAPLPRKKESRAAPSAPEATSEHSSRPQATERAPELQSEHEPELPEPDPQQDLAPVMSHIIANFGTGKLGMAFNADESGRVVLTKATEQAKTQGVLVGDQILKVGDCDVVPSMSLREVKGMIVDATRPFKMTFGRIETESEHVGGTPPPPQKQPVLDAASPVAASSHAAQPGTSSHAPTPDQGLDSSPAAGRETSPSPALSRRAAKRKNRALKAEALTRSKAEKQERAELDRADKERDLARRRAELLEAKANKEVEKAMAKTLAATKASAELAQRTADTSDRNDSEVRTLHEAALRASRAAEAAASAKIDAERVHAAAVKAASMAEADARHSEACAAAADKLRLAHAEAARTRGAALAALGEMGLEAQSGTETDDDDTTHLGDDAELAHGRDSTHNVSATAGNTDEEKKAQDHVPTPFVAGAFARRAVPLRQRTCACGASIGSLTTVNRRSDAANSTSPGSPYSPGQGLTFSVTFESQNVALALAQRHDGAVVVQRVGPEARRICVGDEIVGVNSSPLERCMTPYDVEQLILSASHPLIITFYRADISAQAGDSISKSQPLVVSVLALKNICAPAPRSKGMWNFYVRVKCGHSKAKTSAKRCVSGAEYCEWAEVLQVQTTAVAVRSPPVSPPVRPAGRDGSPRDGGSDASSDNESDYLANYGADSRVFIVELRNRDRYKGSVTIASAVVSLDLVGRGTVACQLVENDQSMFGTLELTLRWGAIASAAQLEFMLNAERQHAARVGIRCGVNVLEIAMKRTSKHSIRRRFNTWHVATEHALDVQRKSQVVRRIYRSWGLWQLATKNSLHAARELELNECTRKLRVGFNLAISHLQDRKACWQAWCHWRTVVEKLRRDEYDASVERLETTAREAQVCVHNAQSADRKRTLVVLQSAALVVLEALAMGLRRRRMQAFFWQWKEFSAHIVSAHAAIFHASLMLQLGSLQDGSNAMFSTLGVSGAAHGARLAIASLVSQKDSTYGRGEWLIFHRSILQQLHASFRLQRSVGRASAAGALQGASLRLRGKWQRAALLHWHGLCSALHGITETFSFVARAEQRFLTMKSTAAVFTTSDAQSVLEQELQQALKRRQKRDVVARMARPSLNRCMNTWKTQVRYQKVVDGIRARGRGALYCWSRQGRGVCAAWRCWRAAWERWKRNHALARIWPDGKPPALLAQYRLHEEECVTHSRHVHQAICIRQMQYVLCGARRAKVKLAMGLWKTFVADAVAKVAATASAVLSADGGVSCKAESNTRRHRLLRRALESLLRPPFARAWRTWVAFVRQPKCGTFADRILHCLKGVYKPLPTTELMQQVNARTKALRRILACYRIHLLVTRVINRNAKRAWEYWAGLSSETHPFGHSSPLRKVRDDTIPADEEQCSTTAPLAFLANSGITLDKSTSCYIKVSVAVQVHALRQLAVIQDQNSCLVIVVNVWRGGFGAPVLVGSFESYSSEASTVALDGAALVDGVEDDDTVTVTVLQRQNSGINSSGFLLGQHTCSAAAFDGTSVDTRWTDAPTTRTEASRVVNADGAAINILPLPEADGNVDTSTSHGPLARLKLAVWRGNEWSSYATRTLLEGCALSISEPSQKVAAPGAPFQQFEPLDRADSVACYAWCSTTLREVVWGKSPYERPDHVWLAKHTCIKVEPGVADGAWRSHCHGKPFRCALTLRAPAQSEPTESNCLHLWCLVSGTGERARDWINALQWLASVSRGDEGAATDSSKSVASASAKSWDQPGPTHAITTSLPQITVTPPPQVDAPPHASVLESSKLGVPSVGTPELGSVHSKPAISSDFAGALSSAATVGSAPSKRTSLTTRTGAVGTFKPFPMHFKVVSVQGTLASGMSISVCVRRHAAQILQFELQLVDAGDAQSTMAWVCEDNLTMLYELDGSEQISFELLHHSLPSRAVRSSTEEAHMCVSDFNQGKKHRLALALGESRFQNYRRESQPVAAVTAELWVGSASADLATQILQCGITISLMECGATVPPHRQRERVCFVLLEGDSHLAWGVDEDNLSRRVHIGQLRQIEAGGPSSFTVSGPAVTLRLKHAQSDEFASNFIEVCSWLQAFEWYIMQQNISVPPAAANQL